MYSFWSLLITIVSKRRGNCYTRSREREKVKLYNKSHSEWQIKESSTILTNARTRSLGVKISPGVPASRELLNAMHTQRRGESVQLYIYYIERYSTAIDSVSLKWFHPERIIHGRKDDRSVAAPGGSIRGIFSPPDENCTPGKLRLSINKRLHSEIYLSLSEHCLARGITTIIATIGFKGFVNKRAKYQSFLWRR